MSLSKEEKMAFLKRIEAVENARQEKQELQTQPITQPKKWTDEQIEQAIMQGF